MVCTGAVLREADLYKTWMPFVTRSDILKWKGQASLLGHFESSVPLMFRDAVIHADAGESSVGLVHSVHPNHLVCPRPPRSTPATLTAPDHPAISGRIVYARGQVGARGRPGGQRVRR